MTPEQKQEHFSKLAAEIQQGLAGALSKPQSRRLQQIQRQAGAPLSFSDPDVVEALALTMEQQTRIRAVQAEFRDASFRRMPFGGDRGPQKNQKDWTGMVLEYLSPEQIAIWKGLTGEPFTGPLHFGPPRRGGPEPHGDNPDFHGIKN